MWEDKYSLGHGLWFLGNGKLGAVLILIVNIIWVLTTCQKLY